MTRQEDAAIGIRAANWIGIGDHRKDAWPFAAKQSEGARDEEALAIAADIVEQDQSSQVAGCIALV